VDGGQHNLDAADLMRLCATGLRLTHEMAIEAGVLQQLCQHESEANTVFGEWDYLTHQVPASPPKPVPWLSWIDIFGYRYVSGYEPTIAKYLVIEVKRDAALPRDVDQVMTYVDWVADEYAGGDYDKVECYLVAWHFPDDVLERSRALGKRFFPRGRKPAQTVEWDDLTLVSYRFDSTTGQLQFEKR
jgi:hypothetical protein